MTYKGRLNKKKSNSVNIFMEFLVKYFQPFE